MSGGEFAQLDVLRLLSSALCVLLRRDMSLNRRVYSWLEGHGAESESQRISMSSVEMAPVEGEEGGSSGGSGDNGLVSGYWL